MAPKHKPIPEWLKNLPLAPEYYPTLAEFQDPISYIHKIEPEASKYGICKIIPPLPPPPEKTTILNFNRSLSARSAGASNSKATPTFTTLYQQIGFCSENPYPVKKSVWQSGESDTFQEFKAKSKKREKSHLKKCGKKGVSPLELETLFWEADLDKPLLVECAKEIVGSGFVRVNSKRLREAGEAATVGETGWNLRDVSRLSGSLLRFMKEDVPGVSVPVMDVSMLFSWFGWHVEDHELHSLNYLHTGAGRTWYGVPADAAVAFEEVVRVHGYKGEVNPVEAYAILSEKTTIISPEVFVGAGIPCCRLVQHSGEFVVTYPRAYHSGHNHGFNCGEATNIATPEWLRIATEAAIRRASINCPPLLTHFQLLYAHTLSLSSRLHMGTSTEPRSSRLKDKKRSEGETIVKKLFVQTVIQNNDLLHILLEQESSCLLLPQNNSVCSNLHTGSKLKAKSKFSLLCSPDDEVGNSKTSAFGDICYGKSVQVTEMNDLLSEKQKPSFVCKSNSHSSLNKKSDHCGNGDICASTSEIEGINNENGSTPQYDGLVQGLFACMTCGILGFACAAVIQPREAATQYFASSDCRFLSDRSELTSCSGGIEKSDQNDLCDVQVQVQSGNCEDQVLNKGVEVVSDTKTQKVISSLDLLASLYGNPEEEQDESPMLVTADENSTEDSSSLCNRNDSSVSTSSHAISNIFPTAFWDTSKCSNAGISGKNTNMLVKQRSDVDASRKYMFCLEHAFEVGKKLQPMGGAQMLLFCHPEYPRVEAEAKLLAGELGINYVWKDIPFKEGTKEDEARIQSVQDDGKATPKDGDWTVKLGINMGYSASLSLSPSSSNQIPYNSVMYKAFGRSSPTNSSVELMSKEESSKQKKISVAGKWCGKVWMSNQVHPFVAQRDTLEQEISVKLCSFATPELKDGRTPTISDTRKEVLLRIENSPQHMTDIVTRQTGKKRKDVSVEEATKKPKHLHREAAEDSPKTSSPPQHGRILRSRQKKCGIEPVLTIRQCDLRVKQEKEGASGPSTRLRKRPLKFSEEVEVKPLRKKQSMKNGQKKGLSCSKKMKIKDEEEECEVKSLRNKPTGKSGKKKTLSCINDMPIKKEEEEYRCDIEGCTMGFSTKKALALHKRNICPIKGCAKKMFTHKYMMQHKKVHVDARPLRCPWKGCKMTFKWGWSRTEHIRVHTGARPYLCPEPGCGQTFRFVSDFSRHRRKMGHSVEKE